MKGLLTDLLTIAGVAALIVGLFAWWLAFKAWCLGLDTETYLKKLKKEPPPGLAKLSAIQAELTEHADSIAALHESLRKLRNKINMRINREDKKPSKEVEVDSIKDPALWKAITRDKLRKEGRLK